ncbi:MAG: hypothetical protein AB7F74_18345 [Parvibaculaceae bacterium]
MKSVVHSAGRPVAVAIVFLSLLALTLCQVLGPSARLNHSFGTGDLSEPALIAASEHITGAHNPLPSRCAAIKLAPVEIKAADFAPAGVTCRLAAPFTSTTPQGAELGVPTPPPRGA